MGHPLIASILVWIAVALAVVCSIGLGVMKNALERLHFSAMVVSFSSGLLVVAIWMDDPDWQARWKAVCIGLLLFLMNAVLSHATARAIRIRSEGQLGPHAEEEIRVIRNERPRGVPRRGRP